jgi:uncharacterized membrane protein
MNMANLVALLLVVFAVVAGIGLCWAIAASGAAAPTSEDTFGNGPPADTVAHNADTEGLAVSTMPVMYIVFFILVGVVMVAGFAWMWKVGRSKPSRY